MNWRQHHKDGKAWGLIQDPWGRGQVIHPNHPPTTPGRAVAAEATGPPHPHSLLLSLGTVTEEEESSGEEEHATQDHDERAEHEGIAQTQELPERGVLGALADQVRDLRGLGMDVRAGPPTKAHHPPQPLSPRGLTKPMR